MGFLLWSKLFDYSRPVPVKAIATSHEAKENAMMADLTFHGMWKRGLVRDSSSRTNPLDLR
ncbi:MAG: hypothetical protein ICV78_03750 [Tolypothrix sp. Co-bin9]|nr:hypothetical protein [Tolypothrix sp. Co-bin9]